jgi:glycosyltransferase involved in cell wall biosynthesis
VRIVLVNRWHDATTPGEQIAADPLRRELAWELSRLGNEVHVVQELPSAARVDDGNVHWHFVPPAPATRAARRLARAFGRTDADVKVPAPHLARAVARLKAEVVHSFDLVNHGLLVELGRDTRRRGAALVAHFHGGAPARLAPWRPVERAAFANVDRFCFTTHEHARPWRLSGAIPDDARVVEIFETSSDFSPGDRAEARARTGLRGEPAFLHLGRLDAVKDPLTTVRAFRDAVARRPGAHLTLAWTDGPLEADVRATCAGLPVTFLGNVSRDTCQDLLRAADVFVQASTREVCGRAALEAFATGTPCLLSDIPSFRRLDGGSGAACLFPVGNQPALAALMTNAAPWATREAVRRRFDDALSFPRLAASIHAMYHTIAGPR